MILLGGPVYVDTKYKGRVSANDLHLSEYNPDAVAKAHKDLGYKAAYAPYIPTTNSDLIKKTAKAFKKHGITLAEVGFWENLQSLNEYERMKNVEIMCDVLACADELGAVCAVNTIGTHTFKENSHEIDSKSFTSDFFDLAVETAKYIINRVKPKLAKLTYENFAYTAMDTLDQMEKMAKAVDSPSFGIHLDASNLVTSVRTFFSYPDLVKEAFKRFGDSIVSCHIKDLAIKFPATHVEIPELAPGEGMLDLSIYLNEINKLSGKIPCMLEHLSTEDEYNRARKNVLSLCESEGLKL